MHYNNDESKAVTFVGKLQPPRVFWYLWHNHETWHGLGACINVLENGQNFLTPTLVGAMGAEYSASEPKIWMFFRLKISKMAHSSKQGSGKRGYAGIKLKEFRVQKNQKKDLGWCRIFYEVFKEFQLWIFFFEKNAFLKFSNCRNFLEN